MREAITALQFKNPIVPVFSNVTAFPQESSENIKKFLIEQVTGRVRWTETIQNMLEMGIEKTIEVGPGRVLSGLSRRISRNLDIQAINTPYDVEEFVKISSIVAAG